MASISHDKKTGRRLIQFVARDGRRKSVRLGKISNRQAETAKRFIEDLVACSVAGSSPKGATAEWIADLPDSIRRRIERVGLISPRERIECPTLAEWVQTYIDGRKDVKEATATVYGHTQRNLLAYFGKSKRLDEITPGDGDAFRIYLISTEGLAENTVRRRMGIAKQFFGAALRKRLILQNPFDGQATVVRENRKRSYFVSVEEAQSVLDACPNPQWRLVFALARYGGLRCSSEVARLKWSDVNWETMRFTIHSSKTEHHADGGIRQVPIFPELYPHLRDAFEQAEPGTVYCCPQYTNANQLYRRSVKMMIERAGLKVWPKLFQNLRSTRETELAEEYPVQVVCAWIGNSPAVAAKHYLQLTDAHFEKAVHFPVQYDAAKECIELCSDTQGDKNHVKNAPNECGERLSMGRTGLEPVTSRV
jgi:integrase